MKANRKKGFFSISAIAEMFSVHPQTIRLYEKEGLITPSRSKGNTRLFTEPDIERLEEIIYLTHELGINLAGVEMILKLKKQIQKLQKDMNKAFEQTAVELERQTQESQQAIKISSQRLLKIRQKNAELIQKNSLPPLDESLIGSALPTDLDWKIEYDE